MAITKKGSRKIHVRGCDYRWRVNSFKKVSDWGKESGILQEAYAATAAKYGLGAVADITFHIPIERYENPVSKIMVKCFGFCVDGFLGIETLMEIKPKTIATIIEHFLDAGWDPAVKGDRHTELYEQEGNRAPALLVIPGLINDGMEAYPNQVHPLQII